MKRQKDKGTKEKLPREVQGGEIPHLYLSSPFKFPKVREWPARVSAKSLSQWMSHKLTAAKTTHSSQIQGCIHRQELSLRPQTDTASSRKKKTGWLLVFLSTNMKPTHKTSETGVCLSSSLSSPVQHLQSQFINSLEYCRV